MEKRRCEQKSSEIASYETLRELESQRLRLHQANPWADKAQREKIFFMWRCFGSPVLRASAIFVQTQAGDLSMTARVSPLSSGGAASRRRERRLRNFWRHEQCSIQMAFACAKHHSFQYRASVGVKTDEAPSLVDEYVAPAAAPSAATADMNPGTNCGDHRSASTAATRKFLSLLLRLHRSLVHFLTRKILPHPCTTKSIRNRLLQHHRRK